MWRFQPIFSLLLLCLSTLAHAQGSGNTSSLWKTLDGKAPLVIARGGFSGIFPDSCENAYQLAGILSLPNVSYWCDVQLTKDGVGICFPDLTLQNGTDIEFAFKDKEATHIVNGKSVQGWFSLDFTLNDLSSIPWKCNGAPQFIFHEVETSFQCVIEMIDMTHLLPKTLLNWCVEETYNYTYAGMTSKIV